MELVELPEGEAACEVEMLEKGNEGEPLRMGVLVLRGAPRLGLTSAAFEGTLDSGEGKGVMSLFPKEVRRDSTGGMEEG
jgi:hypothetical protein